MSWRRRHIAPHRLALLASGQARARAADKMRRHIGACGACARKLERLGASQEVMRSLRDQDSPELGWDHIFARIYWSISSASRNQQRMTARRPRRYGSIAALAMVCAASATALLLWLRPSGSEPASSPQRMAAEATPVQPVEPVQHAEPVAAPEARPIHGLVTFVQGAVRVDEASSAMEAPVAAGTMIATDEGIVAVQFGQDSAFKLEPHSHLSLRRFDTRRIELDVQGAVSVDITHRPDDQEFVVVAGGHQVVVRGTAFRVQLADGELGVSCVRGRVVVTDGEDAVDVSAGQMFHMLASAWKEAALRSVAIPAEQLAPLHRAMYVPMLPVWNEREVALSSSSLIDVSAAEGQWVAIDGVEVGRGSFQLRAMSGRHQVSPMDDDGEVSEGRWITSSPAERVSARIDAPEDVPARSLAGARRQRKAQLRAALEASGRPRGCIAPLSKKGLEAGSYIVFELGVHADGGHEYLNVVDSNLSPVIQKCLRHAVDDVRLPAGSAASFRYRLAF